VSGDQLLIARLEQYSRKNPLISIVSADRLSYEGFDAALLPAALLLSPSFPRTEALCRLRAAGCSLIGFGAPEALPGCFLAGCDEYLRDPWNPEELAWRLRRLRKDARAAFRFTWGTVELHGLELRCPAGRCSLCAQEQSILRLLAGSRGEPVSRETLYYGIWGRLPSERSRVVDMHVCSLRRKLRRLFPGGSELIRSVRGVGYLIAR
jgi:hypothetical protein